MEKLFIEEEISKAFKKLENGKSRSIDNRNAEYIKHVPGIIQQIIADTLRKRVATNDYLEILKGGIITHLQKLPKKTKK